MAGKVVIEASAKHTATGHWNTSQIPAMVAQDPCSLQLIFLHGLGDTGHGWASTLAEIRPAYVKLICPTAPVMPVTLNAGFRMPSWFDLRSLSLTEPEDEAGIKSAAKNVHLLIEEEEKAGIPSNRIVLGGFSQGGALALYSAFEYKKQLGGVVALSCWLPLRQLFPIAALGNKETRILQCHGDSDPVVPLHWGQESYKMMKTFAPNSNFKTYMGLSHSSSTEELSDIADFMKEIMPSL
ncbi:acyl-protein thioesterase 1-like isoform X1 [Artemia franciscana]|uniref:acyl-protein thioesterase 1-like isoform X1 n=1 Tax=Artemia franciscana TaxID=6661 RepID=UPI0032D9D0BB